MHELKIACGKSCYTKVWDNCSVTWEELCNRLKSTARTYETVEEYKVMNRDARSSVKDRGGFVGGHLKDGRRKIDHVECRSMITLDADHAEPGFINRFAQECEYAAVIYTTHSHTPNAPRARIIVPLEREIAPERYAAVSRYFASLWGIDQFDECSYKVNQLMYWPTMSSDGEYICRITKGSFLDADAFLANYPGWNDCTTLPKSSRETEIKINSGKNRKIRFQRKVSSARFAVPILLKMLSKNFCQMFICQYAQAVFAAPLAGRRPQCILSHMYGSASGDRPARDNAFRIL